MANLLNKWVGYADRTYEQIKANVLVNFQVLVPEITDLSESNPWVKGVSIWSGIAEMLGYYIDNRARETFLSTCKKFESAVKIARQYDYRIKGTIAATVDLTFTLDNPAPSLITIPSGTVVRTTEGIEFRTTQNATISIGEDSVQVSAKQWTPTIGELLGTSNGSVDQKYELLTDVVDNSISVVVGIDNFLPVDTFAYSIPTDKNFVAGLDEFSVMTIRFGDNMAGAVPGSGQDIVASYYVSLGLSGNVGRGLINTIVSTITLPPGIQISVTNINPASGGADSENLSRLKKTIPLSLRTKNRAVTDQDFIDIAQLVPGVAKSGVEYSCGVGASIYIAPEGGGVASQLLLEETYDFFYNRKIIRTPIVVFPAGELIIALRVNANALPNYRNDDVRVSIENSLLGFLNVENQEIKGTLVIGDIYEKIESSLGVKNSSITLFSAIPYARPIENTTNILNWDRIPLPDSLIRQHWNIRFITTTTFELKRNNDFINTFSTGFQVNLPEILFTINGTYDVNDEYDFVTYPYNERMIELDEPSIPVAILSSLDITVTGGIV